MDERLQTDVLIIGSGLAGLACALTVAPHARVLVCAKAELAATNTSRAQGGIAAVLDPSDSIEAHIADTLTAGCGLCHEDTVRSICADGPAAIRQLMTWGVRFSGTPGGAPDLTREGGHSARRILHSADATGESIEGALLQTAGAHPHITLAPQQCAIDLIVHDGAVRGAYVLDKTTGRVRTIAARLICLATGGMGKVYLYTSNPDVASGDGLAMAYRAGARVANCEFMQFHPTCLFHPEAKSFLISEAVRGEGGLLRLPNGERFMPTYDPRAELATRDIVARAIDAELKRTGYEFALLDIAHRPARFIQERFPTIYATCLRYGIDMTTQPIPVVPAAHYHCGGVVTDLHGRTDLPNLYAVGEVAATGIHGANRLASNSLLEAAVMGIRAGEAMARDCAAAGSQRGPRETALPLWDDLGTSDTDEAVVITHNWDEVRRTMWNYVGIVRTTKRLLRAQARIARLQEEIREFYWNFSITSDLIELRNLALVAELVIRSALQRKESRGLHCTLDHPHEDPRYQHDTVLAGR
ncbi:MAG: L-aspartate oxidase [Deltaproteobacteria bacterium]|nr:L-aspartate oxidase [Deltaproteobacteria bacterium]